MSPHELERPGCFVENPEPDGGFFAAAGGELDFVCHDRKAEEETMSKGADIKKESKKKPTKTLKEKKAEKKSKKESKS